MRLPQSSNRPLSVFFASTVILAALTAVPLLGARQVPNQLVCSPSNVRFGTVVVGQSENQEMVLTNNGESSATVSAISVGSSEFSISGISLPATLSAGQSVAVTVAFSPESIGSASTKITITSNAQNPSLQVGILGSGVKSQDLSATPSSLSFGQVSVGSSATSSVVVSNPHSWSETITALQMIGTGFSVSGPNMPVTLASGQSITLSVSFSPQAAGADAASVFVSGDGLDIPLSGTGTAVGQLSVTPGSLGFGNVDVGTSTTQPSTMTASGGSVTVSSASSSNSQFSISGVSLPVTIGAGQSVSFDVVFAPTKTGSDSATIELRQQCLESRQRIAERHRHCPAIQRQPVLECQYPAGCRLQRVSRHRNRGLFKDQSNSRRQHGIHRRHGSVRRDLLLRGHVSEFQRTGKRLLHSSGGSGSVEASARI